MRRITRVSSQTDPKNNVGNCNFEFYVFERPEDDPVMVETCSLTLL